MILNDCRNAIYVLNVSLRKGKGNNEGKKRKTVIVGICSDSKVFIIKAFDESGLVSEADERCIRLSRAFPHRKSDLQKKVSKNAPDWGKGV